MNLGDLRWPDLTATSPVLAVPLGACEQHGPHLPLNTDTTIAVELCRRLAQRIPDIVVAPAVPYGSSGEHAGFPGTLSIGQTALELLILELVRSADHFTGVVLVNAHGGNLTPLHAATRQLQAEQRRVLPWTPTGPPHDTHAGHTETSIMLQLQPHHVTLSAAEPGNTTPLPHVIDQLRQSGVAAVSPNGILGDPTAANPTHGESQLQHWTDTLVADVTTWLAHPSD